MRRPVLLLVLAVALIAAFWRWQPAEAPRAAGAAPNPTEGGYVASNALLTDTGDDGQPRFRLRASTVTQAGAGGEVRLEEPRLDYEGAGRWQLSARTGELPEDARHVSLGGGVEARGMGARELPLVIRTDSLEVDVASQRATTDARVTVELGRNRLQGHGLVADMKADVLRLESDIHGEYFR